MSANSPCKKITQRRHDERIARIRLFIDTHSDVEGAMSLGFLANLSGWTPFHFHRVFRTIVGEPVGHYVRRKRLEYVVTCLALPAAKIDEIAERVGYESACVFARAFKKMFGVSPGAFIQRQQSTSTDAPSMRLTGKWSKHSKICN